MGNPFFCHKQSGTKRTVETRLMQHSTRNPTKYEAERIEAMLRLGCVCCATLGIFHVAECHHILDGGVRMGHWFSLPLCPGHHRAMWNAEQIELIAPKKRVAINDGRKRFVAVYGTERSLWERCQTKLGLSLAWPMSKVLPRRIYVADTDLQRLANDREDSGSALSGTGLGMALGARAVRGEPS